MCVTDSKIKTKGIAQSTQLFKNMIFIKLGTRKAPPLDVTRIVRRASGMYPPITVPDNNRKLAKATPTHLIKRR